MAAAKPVHKVRAGQVSCALWENSIRIGNVTKPVLRCTVERRYKDSDGAWKSSNSFGRNEIPLALWCLQKAFDHIIEEGNNKSEDSIEEETIS